MSNEVAAVLADMAPIAPAEAPVSEVMDEVLTEQDEAPLEEVKPKEDERLAARFAALSRKERQLVEREKSLKETLARIESFERSQDLKKANPLEWLKTNELSYDQLTRAILDQGEEKVPTAEDKVSELEKKLQEFEARQAQKEKDREQKYIEEQVSIYKKNIEDTVASDPDTYELIHSQGAHDTVFEVVEEYFNKTGKVLPVKQALDYVENHLFEEAQKFLKVKKLAPKVKSEPKPEPVKESLGKALKESQAPSVTLTNAKVTGVVPVEKTRRLTAEESKRAAAAMLKWS